MQKHSKILLVEDEPALAEAVILNLELDGYSVDHVVNGSLALKNWQQMTYDLIVLDVMIPEINGFDVCRAIRVKDKSTPILFLSARSQGEDRIEGLKIGGDDYLSKPFHLEEFLLRVGKLIDRTDPVARNTSAVQFGGNTIDFTSFTAESVNSGRVQLSARELKLLHLLISRADQVVSRDDILNLVWGDDESPSTRSIDNFILAFRKHFEPDPKHPIHFVSIRGVGYRFSKS